MLKNIFRIGFIKPNCIKNLGTSTSIVVKVTQRAPVQFQSVNFCTKLRYAGPRKDVENQYAFSILNNEIGSPSEALPKRISTPKDFEELLDRNWKKSNITDIVETFVKVKDYCITNDVQLSNPVFDKLVDGFVDNCEHITDEQLINLLHTLIGFPVEFGYSTHNFHDLWSCLDDVCCWKIVSWDIQKCFTVGNLWYQLRLGRLCDFLYVVTDRLVKKADDLSKDELINIYFYFNIMRRRAVDFEYEYALEKLIKEMSVDEMAVVAMGYFKSRTKIKVDDIQIAMCEALIKNADTVKDISASAILKALRFSNPFTIFPKVQEMTEKLYPQIDRFSHTSCTHLALMSTGIRSCNKKVLQKISEKLVKDIGNKELVRSKDIERLLNTLTMFNYDPSTKPDIFQAALQELKNNRLDELQMHAKVLISILNYFSLKGIYSYEFLDKILDMEFIKTQYGKVPRNVPRDVLFLDCSIDIECPDYKGNRIPAAYRTRAIKYILEYIPSHDQWKKITLTDQLILNVIDSVKSIVGDEKLMFVGHVLPHFSRADIVLCRDSRTGSFVKPEGFEKYQLGDIMFPQVQDKNLDWIALVIVGPNHTVSGFNKPLMGLPLAKNRQLTKMGYNPVLIHWFEFTELKSEHERKEYILKKLEYE
ncbi:unnamed protein product [Phyllotreta striolata]|uniref:RAP domain-containing protein n=1 Tax=Phyllotreta striolata TaxID=444603 RepID=A0A9N9XU78_PHYSR|nr:unnamed protein product [Phyllotreta striolata]